MFSSNKAKTPTNPITIKEQDLTCIIGEGSIIEGKFRSTENLRLDGRIKGDVECDKKIVMGEKAVIDGKVVAFTASIQGKIKGDLEVKDILHLQKTAVVEGNIKAKSFLVDEGAQYNGECKIGQRITAPDVVK